MVGAGLAAFLAPGPAGAAPTCTGSTGQEGTVVTETPWSIRRYGLDRLAGIADGRNIRVAVIDSGVDAGHPQLKGAVLPGLDLLDGSDGRFDCIGHGTAVAGIIVGQPTDGTGFRGIAPAAKAVAVRVTEQQDIEGGRSGRVSSSAQLAEAIRRSVDEHKAQVLNLSLALYRDDPAVRAAIANAVAKDVVVVAAVGNKFEDGNPVPYPASYPGVIGVGAINEDGQRWKQSQVGDYVDLVAPGGDIVSSTRTKGHLSRSGTSFAAPVVAATAALIRSYDGKLTAAQVAARLAGTADPAPGGPRSREYGVGVVNPYRAVTARLGGAAEPIQALPAPTRDVAAERAAERAARTRSWALALAAAGGGAAGLVVLGAAVLPRGSRRRWRAGTRPLPAPRPAGNDDPF